MHLPNMLKNKVVQNAGWMIGGKILQMLLLIAINMLVARYLGKANYGIINYVQTYISIFSVICLLGLDGIMVKFLLDYPQAQGEIIGSAIFMRIIASTASIAVITLIIYFDEPRSGELIAVSLLQSGMLVFHSFDIINYWFQSRLESKYIMMIQLLTTAVLLAYRAYILWAQKSILWFAFDNTLHYLIIACFLLIVFHKRSGLTLSVSLIWMKKMFAQSYHFIISAVIGILYSQMDKIMIKKMIGFEAVGLYSAAVIICGYMTFVFSAIIDSARPMIIRNKSVNEEIYVRQIKQLYAVVFYLSLIISLFFSVFAKWIVLVLYGRDYIMSVNALRIVVFYSAFSYVGGARSIWIITEKQQKYLKYLSLAGVAINFALNYTMIPVLGINGAAIATLITNFATVIVIPAFIPAMRPDVKHIIQAVCLRGVLKNEAKDRR